MTDDPRPAWAVEHAKRESGGLLAALDAAIRRAGQPADNDQPEEMP